MADIRTIEQQISELRSLYEGIRDERRTYANTATRIGNAFLALLSYIEHAPFLRKDQADTAEGLLTLLAGCTIGESKQIRLNPDGSINCGSITVDGSAIFNELVFNHQNVLEGDTYFTDKGIIDKVEHTDIDQYTLTFRKEYAEDRVTFHVNDILLGKVNNLDRGKTYRSFWLRVDFIDTDENTAVCTMYSDADVPGGKNSVPAAAARVIRWGNTIDESRQNVWFVSAKDGRWLFLQGVSKPILDDSENGSNYVGFIGLPPDITAVHELIEKGQINKSQPYSYFRGVIAQDFIQVDYKGKPVYTARDCGQWNASRKYIHGYDSVAKGYFSDRVWWKGCYWQCAIESSSGSEPHYGNTDWVCLLGGDNMAIDIQSTAGNWFRAGTDWETTLVASVWNADMKMKKEWLEGCTVQWTRESDDADGDTAWNARKESFHEYSLPVSSKDDLPSVWQAGSKVGYKIVVTFPDGSSYDNDYTIIN